MEEYVNNTLHIGILTTIHKIVIHCRPVMQSRQQRKRCILVPSLYLLLASMHM